MVTGLGGVFIKAKEPKFLARWYEDNLGVGFKSALYFSFKWREMNAPEEISYTVLSFFKEDTTYFYPATNEWMLNFRVNDLDDLRIKLQNDGANVIEMVESYEYGRFGWVLDPEGNKIELWEPIDAGFEDRNYPMDLKFATGIGGVSLKCAKVDKLTSWYSKHFGLFFNNSVHTFQWKDFNDKNISGETTLSFNTETASYFDPSKKDCMISLRVENLDTLLNELRTSEVEMCETTEEFSHGKFGWILDPEGNKIELWQPDQD